jgi:long-subunit fatty acid transport protein
VSRQSALSIGLKPYSELGYGFRNQVTIGTNANNTKNVNHIYNGEGGISNAYLGYGIQFGDHFRAGVNAEYLFGNLIESNATEFINEPGSMNSKNQVKNSIYGFNLGYGLQYDIRLDKKTGITLGYSGSAKHRLNSEMSKYATIYQLDMNGNELSAIDTLDAVENNKTNLTLPTTHNFGISIHKENKWLVGADVRTGQWSSYNVANVNQNLQNTFGISVGGQITPDASAISGYFKRVDYRLGFLYDKTYIQMNGQDIKQTAITFGLGLPLASYARSSFYKMNISAEIGKRGKLTNGLIQENYFNINLGFMLNDRWFQRFKFD